MAKKGTLTVRVISDTKAAEQGLDRFATKVSTTGDRLQEAGKRMTMFATVPVAAAMGLAVNAASDLNETLSKSNTVFGQSAKTVEDWADGAVDDFGQSKRAALDAASTFGNMFVQLGVGADQAAAMSMEMTELASDFASFHNADISDVIDAQSAAFRGEYDALQRFIPTISAATVEQEAMAQTGKRNTDELTAQEKALAVQTIMLGQAGDALGDYDRTANGAANQTRRAKAAMEEAAAEIGENLLPLAAKAAGGVADLATKFGELPEPVQNSVLGLAALVAVAGPVAGAAGTVINGISKLRDGASSAADGIETLRLRSMYLRDVLGGPAGLAAGLGAVGAVVAVGATLYGEYADTKAEARRITDLYVDALKSENDELDKNVDLVGANELANKEYATAIRESGVGFDTLIQAVRESGDALESLDDDLGLMMAGLGGLEEALERAGLNGTSLGDALTVLQGSLSQGDFADLINDLDGLSDRYDNGTERALNHEAAERAVAEATGDAADAQAAAKGPTEDLATEADKAAEAQKDFEDAIKGVTSAIRGQFDPFLAATDAMLANQDAQRKVEEAHWAVTKASDDLAAAIEREGKESWAAKDAARNLEEAQRDLAGAERDAGRSAIDVATSMTELRTRVKEGNLSIDEGARMLDQWAEQGLITKGQAEQLKLEMFYASLAAQDLGRQKPTVVLSLEASQFWQGMADARAALSAAQWQASLASPYASRSGMPIRHTGGPAQAGRMYLTGGKGREELFIPHADGQVLSPAKTRDALAPGGAGGGRGSTYNITIHNPVGRTAEDTIRHELRRIQLMAI